MELNIENLNNKKALHIYNTTKEETPFVMPNENTVNKVILATHFISFCRQSVKGSIMAIYRVFSDEGNFTTRSKENVRDILRNGNFVFENNVKYLNFCWAAYFNNSDEYIKRTFDFLRKYFNNNNNSLAHESCVFNYVWEFSQTLLFYVLARLDVSELRDTDFLSQCIDIILDAILSFHYENIVKSENVCNADCKVYEYKNGEDFIKINKVK